MCRGDSEGGCKFICVHDVVVVVCIVVFLPSESNVHFTTCDGYHLSLHELICAQNHSPITY